MNSWAKTRGIDACFIQDPSNSTCLGRMSGEYTGKEVEEIKRTP